MKKIRIKKRKPLWLIIIIGLLPLLFFIFFKISISAVLVLGVMYAVISYFLLGPEILLNAFLAIVFGLVAHSNPYNFIEVSLRIVNPQPGLSYEDAYSLHGHSPFILQSPMALVDYIGTYVEPSPYAQSNTPYYAIPIIDAKSWHKDRSVLLWATCVYATQEACVQSWLDIKHKKLEFYPIYRNQFVQAARHSMELYNIAAGQDMKFVRLYNNAEVYWQWVYLVSVFAAWIVGALALRTYVIGRKKEAQ